MSAEEELKITHSLMPGSNGRQESLSRRDFHLFLPLVVRMNGNRNVTSFLSLSGSMNKQIIIIIIVFMIPLGDVSGGRRVTGVPCGVTEDSPMDHPPLLTFQGGVGLGRVVSCYVHRHSNPSYGSFRTQQQRWKQRQQARP